MNSFSRRVQLDAAREALDVADGDMLEAATLMGVHRSTLYRILRNAKEIDHVKTDCANVERLQDAPQFRVHAIDGVTDELLAREVVAGRTRLIVLIKHKEDNE